GRHAEAAREVARLLKRVREPHEFDVLVRLAAQRLGVREETLRREGAPGVAPAAAPDEPHAPGAEAMLVELMAEDATLAERVAAGAMRFAPPRRAEIRKPWKPPCAA